MNRKRILIISYHFPPYLNSRSIRLYNIVNYLSTKGWIIDVLTVKRLKNIDELLLSNIKRVKNINIYYLKPNFLLKIFHENGSYRNNTSDIIDQKRMRDTIKKYLPERELFWFLSAIPSGKKIIKKNNYSLIMSSAQPYICHVIGSILSRFGKIPHILEYGDLWSLDPLKNKWKNLNNNLESKIFSHASSVLFTTNEIKMHYSNNFPNHKNKFHAIYSGFHPDDFIEIKPSSISDSNIHIHYIGHIYDIRTNIEPFLLSVMELNEDKNISNKIIITFIGNITKNRRFSEFNGNNIQFTGPVDYKTSLRDMKSADILLLFGNKYGLQIPLKTYLYLGAQRPIIVILGDKQDPLKKLLKGYKHIVITNNREEDIKKALLDILNYLKSNTTIKQYDSNEIISQFSWEHQLDKIDYIFNDVVK